MDLNEMSREQLIAEVERLRGVVESFTAPNFSKLHAGMLDNLQGAVMATDTEMNLIYWNRYSEIMHQYKAEEVLGKNIIDIRVPPENREKARAVTASMIKNGYLEGEFETIRKDGSRFPTYIKSTALRDSSGKVVGFVGIHVDLTDRKKSEAEIKKLAAALEEKVSAIQEKYEDTYQQLKRETLERRRSESMLCESEEKMRLFLDNVPAHVGLVSPDGKYLIWNKFSETMFGYSPEEVVGKKVTIDMHASREEAADVIRLATSEGRFDGEVTLKRKDSSTFPAHLVVVPWRSAKGETLGYYGIAMDIAKMKESELKLRVSEESLRAISNASTDSIILIDRSGKVIEINEACEKFSIKIGLSKKDVIGNDVTKFASDEVNEVNLKYFRKVVDEGMPQKFEGEYHGLRLAYSFYPVFAEDNSVRAVAVYVSDMTEAKNAEEALEKSRAETRKSEEMYRALAESSDEMIFMIDDEGVVKYVNNFAARSYGRPASEIIGKKHDDLFPPETVREHNANLRKVFETGKPVYSYDRREHMGDGRKTLWLDSILMPLKDKNGKTTSVIGISRDITERKKFSEELIRSSKLEALGTLAGGIAHDFNNVLMGIIGNVSMARKRAPEDERLHELLQRAEKIAYKAKNLTEQLITFSRGGEPVKKTIAVGELLKETAQFATTGSNVECEFSISEGMWPVEVDEGQIAQVFANIVINAQQSMPDGGRIIIAASNVSVESDGAALVPQGRYVSVSITDTGCGISPEDMPRIFDPFFSCKEKGKGLGLATAYSIIKKHFGVVSVESEKGRGTTFTVMLPASEKSAEPEKTSRADSNCVSHTEHNGCRVLVMDDEESVLFPICDMLVDMGCKVHAALSGEQACEEYERSMNDGDPFDVLILDLIVKGGMGGIETFQKIRQANKDARAIVSSGYSNDPVMANYKEYGFCGALIKPYRQEHVSEVLERFRKSD